MRKITLLLFFLGLCCLSFVTVLYWNSLPDDNKKNGFNRRFEKYPPKLLYSATLDHADYYFAGWDDSTCYLGTLKTPTVLLKINLESRLQKKITLSDHAIKTGKISIVPPHFYLSDLERFHVYRGDVGSWTSSELYRTGDFFTEIEPTVYGSLIFRTFNLDKTEFVLSNTLVGEKMERHPNLLEKQIDGLFCVDGMLRIDPVSQRVVYTYFYRNQFVCTDTSLHLLYRANTIDTISRAQIKVAVGKESLASPPFTVNRKSITYDGFLYINSNLKSDNESWKQFRASDVIDIYRLDGGTYLTSFYIPKIEGKRLRHFGIFKNRLYVLHDEAFQVYVLRMSITSL